MFLQLFGQLFWRVSLAICAFFFAARLLGEQRPRDWLAFSSNGGSDVLVNDLSAHKTINLRQTMPANIRFGKMQCVEGTPTWSKDGRLAFIQYCGSEEADVLILDFTNGHLTNFTANPAHDTMPAWSNDGLLAFSSNRANEEVSEIYIGDPRTGEIINASNGMETVGAPAWSNDGRLAFTGVVDRLSPTIFVRDPDGTLTRVTTNPPNGSDPIWSPDGQLAYIYGTELYVLDWSTGTGVPATNRGGYIRQAVWSPDNRLTYSGLGSSDIFAVDPLAGVYTNLTQHAKSEILPAWSHDGRLAFMADWGSDYYTLHVMDVATGEIFDLGDKLGATTSPAWAR